MLIFNSSTLILIAKSELLDAFLADIGMEIAIPKAVEDECCGGKKTLDALFIRRALDDSRIKVKNVSNRKLVAKLEEDFNMGRGESEAIALALEEKALLVGMLNGREFVSAPEQREVLPRPVGLHLPENVFELDHTHS